MREIGVQFHVGEYELSEYVELSEKAKEAGLDQVWITDNLGARNPFVVLTAIASKVPIRLGTGVLVQYFRSPMDTADALATISELMDGRELSIGIARGNLGATPNQVDIAKPISMLRETAQSLRRLLAGESVRFGDYPTVASYFNLKPDADMSLNFKAKTPLPLYSGGTGTTSIAVGGEFMDGVIFGAALVPHMLSGKLNTLFDIADTAARKADANKKVRRIAHLSISVSPDSREAKESAKYRAAGTLMSLPARGYTSEDIARMGLDVEEMERLWQKHSEGASRREIAGLLSDAMLDSSDIAGDAKSCHEQLERICPMLEAYGFEQVFFAVIGANHKEGLRFLYNEAVEIVKRG